MVLAPRISSVLWPDPAEQYLTKARADRLCPCRYEVIACRGKSFVIANEVGAVEARGRLLQIE